MTSFVFAPDRGSSCVLLTLLSLVFLVNAGGCVLRSLFHSFRVFLGINDSTLQSDNVVVLFLLRDEKVQGFCLMWHLIRMEFQCQPASILSKRKRSTSMVVQQAHSACSGSDFPSSSSSSSSCWSLLSRPWLLTSTPKAALTPSKGVSRSSLQCGMSQALA